MYPVRAADLPEFDVNIHGRSTCACVCTRARIIVADEPWRGTACVYTADFKRPNIFRALKLLTGVSVVGYSTLQNCGTLVALMLTFLSPSRVILIFAYENAVRRLADYLFPVYDALPHVNAICHYPLSLNA